MNVEIAQRLAARRKQAGLSQESLAERLGVSRQAVSKWERSESSPDTDNLIALAQLYGVSLDELLYVDDSIKDDMAFESVDRAAEHTEAAAAFPDTKTVHVGEHPVDTGEDAEDPQRTAPADTPQDRAGEASGTGASPADAADPSKVHIGFDGIHVEDGEDYVHVSWRDGVHVIDGKKGEEVHVGWNGIHVKDPRAAHTHHAHADGAESRNRSSGGEDSGSTAQGDEDHAFSWDGSGIRVNGEQFDNWQDAHEKYHHGHESNERRHTPCGYKVCGERFATLDEARMKYGPEVGKSIPVREWNLHAAAKVWVRFPYPLVVIVAYVLLGIVNDAWGMGLFLFLTIPLYYMIVHAIGHRRIAPLISGAYPIGVVAWFCYMAFVMNEPHPAWVAFLTIPLVEWLVHGLSSWWRVRKRRKETPDVIDVETR